MLDGVATDAHCHLDRFGDVTEVLRRARAAGVVRVVAVTFTPSHYASLLGTLGREEGVELALGLHPMAVAGAIPFMDPIDLDAELALAADHVAGARFVGEVGLDLSPEGAPSREAQEQALGALLAVPGMSDKVLTLHSRGAVPELIALLRAAGARRPILHSYTGAVEQLDEVLEAGCHVSINPAMTRTDEGRLVIAALPPERVLAETDGPFMQLDGRSLEPRDLAIVHEHLAGVWDLTPAEVADLLDANLQRLMG